MFARAWPLVLVALAACAHTPAPSVTLRDQAPDVLAWQLEVARLPGVDDAGRVVVGKVTHGFIASSLGLKLHWLEQGKPTRSFVVLDEAEVSNVVYDRDGAPELVAALGATTRARVADANRQLQPPLRAMVPCRLAGEHGLEITCGDLRRTLDERALGWWHPPERIVDDGPPSEMVTHVLEAHWDPRTRQLVALVDHRCQVMLGDACFLPEEWRLTRID